MNINVATMVNFTFQSEGGALVLSFDIAHDYIECISTDKEMRTK